MSTQQPVTVRVGTVWDVLTDGTVQVVFGSGPAVAGIPIGAIPPLRSPVLCVSTYDRLYVLGPDVRKADMPQPNPPTRMAKVRDNGLRLAEDGGWWTLPMRAGTWVGRVGAGGQVTVPFDPPIRTDVHPYDWVVLAQFGNGVAMQSFPGAYVAVEARDRTKDAMLLRCVNVPKQQIVRINWMLATSTDIAYTHGLTRDSN